MSGSTTRRRAIQCPYCGPGKGRVFEDEPAKRGHAGRLWCFNCRKDIDHEPEPTNDEKKPRA